MRAELAATDETLRTAQALAAAFEQRADGSTMH